MQKSDVSVKASGTSALELPTQTRNYPYNCWWVAALSEEVSRDFLSRWIAEIPVLFYRREDGTPVAMLDRCPHRSVPLSLGTLQGDNVICGYHGFEFASNGKCVRVPTQGNAGSISARSFPLFEQYPVIWIYTGDIERIDEVAKPFASLDWASEADMVVFHGYSSFDANYMSIQENVIDLTHVPHVHAKTLQEDWVEPPAVTVEGDVVIAMGPVERGPLIPYFSMGSDIEPGKILDLQIYSTFQSPAIHKSGATFSDPAPGPADRKDYAFHMCHITTPIDMKSVHYWWIAGRDYGRSDDEFKQNFVDLTTMTFNEDKAMLEASQIVVDRLSRLEKPIEFSVSADRASIEARRAGQRWMAREA